METNARIKSGLIATALSISTFLACVGSVIPGTYSRADAQVPNQMYRGQVTASPGTASPNPSDLSSRLLLQARKSLAEKDINGAEKAIAEATALNVQYAAADDRPEYVAALVRMHRETMNMYQKGGDTVEFRRQYAELLYRQADGFFRKGELDMAETLAGKSLQLGVNFSETAIQQKKDPRSLLQTIADRKAEVRGNRIPMNSERETAQLSGLAQEQLKKAEGWLMEAQREMNAGNIQRAEEICNHVRGLGIPESAFRQNGLSPNAILGGIAAKRNGNGNNPIIQTSYNDGQGRITQPLYDSRNDRTAIRQVQGESEFIVPSYPTADSNNSPVMLQPYDQAVELDEGSSLFRQARPLQNLPEPSNDSNRLGPIAQYERELAGRDLTQQFDAHVGNRISNAYEELRGQTPLKALEIIREAKAEIEAAEIDQLQKAQLLGNLKFAEESIQRHIDTNRSRIDLQARNDKVMTEVRERNENRDYREQRVKELIDEANVLINEHQFTAALDRANKAKEIDPNNSAAIQLLQNVKVMRNLAMYRDTRDLKADRFNEHMQATDMASTPMDPNRDMDFDFDRLRKAQRRLSTTDLMDTRSEFDRAIYLQLETPIALDFEGKVPLGEVLAYIQNVAQVNMIRDPEVEARSNEPVTASIGHAIPIKYILNQILSPLELTYVVEDGCLKITTQAKGGAKKVTKYYYVGDLVTKQLNFNNNKKDSFSGKHRDAVAMVNAFVYGNNSLQQGTPVLQNYDQSPVNYTDGSSVRQFLGGNSGRQTVPFNTSSGNGYSPYGSDQGNAGGGADFGQLIDLIQMVVKPNTWGDSYGGTSGSGITEEDEGKGTMMEYYNTLSLVIRHTDEAHNEIADLLEQLRKLNDLQVTIEVRFITLSDSYVERMGVNFAMNIPNKNFPRTTRPVDANGKQVNDAIIGYSDKDTMFNQPYDITMKQGNFDVGVPPGFTNFSMDVGTSIGFSILSDIESYFFINAAQQDTRSSILQAPKITIFNGQTGNIRDETERPFVTSVVPVVGDFAAAYQPVVTILSEGTSLNVHAIVDSKRQHVKITLNPRFTTIVDASQTFRFTGEESETTEDTSSTTGDPSSPTVTDENEKKSTSTKSISGVSIQQPVTSEVEINTIVSVPDGGTILMGGIKRLSEGRNEAGTPMLDKVPFLKRLFTNVGVGRDTSTMMMMVTPRIIIQEEEEEFIMGSSPVDN